jgi:hypothetical protein
VHRRLGSWIGAVLAIGLVVAGVHVAGPSDASAGVTTSAPPVVRATPRAGTVRAPALAATTSTLAIVPVTSTVIAQPATDASAPADIVIAQPISFVTTDSPSPAAAPAPTHSVALYGDSLTVMAWDHYLWITANDIATDGHRYNGTQLSDWRDSILANPNDHLVLALGTNDALGDGAAPWADLFNKLPASKCIVWPKPYEGGSKVKLFNAQMTAIVAAHPNVHVIDWNAQVQAHPEWVQYDQTHYLPDGSNKYAEMLRQAALTCP